ncbi:hypothetical protein BDZ89DRAFT_1047849 [Hymenopellis radicata]|nr:hypothetical protein BDZ89DRAFT_1047849 [Hymenopellis radicata]
MASVEVYDKNRNVSATLHASSPYAPQVAIIRHDVMQVAHHCFENGIHGAYIHYLRERQRCGFIDEADGVKKSWREGNVSDDFDRALRPQVKGYIIRWATYSNGGVKVLRPLITWWLLDPTTKQLLAQAELRTFTWSATPTQSKNYTMSILRAIANVSFSVTTSGYVSPSAGNQGYTLGEDRVGKRSILSSVQLLFGAAEDLEAVLASDGARTLTIVVVPSRPLAPDVWRTPGAYCGVLNRNASHIVPDRPEPVADDIRFLVLDSMDLFTYKWYLSTIYLFTLPYAHRRLS